MDRDIKATVESHILKAGSSTCVGLQPAIRDDGVNGIAQPQEGSNSDRCTRVKRSKPFSVHKTIKRRMLVCRHPGCGKKYRLLARLYQHEQKHMIPRAQSIEEVLETEQDAANFWAVKKIFQQLADFEYPSFFQSRQLPYPTTPLEPHISALRDAKEQRRHEYNSNERACGSFYPQPALFFSPFANDSQPITYGT